jgi:hypothetical protein
VRRVTYLGDDGRTPISYTQLTPDRTGLRIGVALALVAVGVGAFFASDLQVKKYEKAFRERGEFVPMFPFQPPPPFTPTPESVGGPQPEATQRDLHTTDHVDGHIDSKSLEATLDDIARRLKNRSRP